jgi:hypothetical protein
MPSEAPEFARLQRAFAAHIRDPGAHPMPAGVEDRRMAVYRDLLFNNVREFLAGTFPVLRRIYGEAGWSALIREYFARHRARTPLFLQMPREFLAWLDDERGGRPEDPPFLRELAHYEWVELALSVDSRDPDDPVTGGYDAQGDLLHGVPVLSPLAWPQAYTWPVHRIGPDFQPQEPPAQPTYLLVYRDRADAVGFLEMNPVTARLVELIGAEPAPTGREALERIAAELAHPDPQVVISGGLGILEDLRRRDVILGSRAGA